MALQWSHLLVAGLWGGLLALERRAFLQAMVSRPLAAATGAGLLLGDLSSGAAVGLVFELLYLGTASLGTAQPEYETLPAVAAAVLAATLDAALGNPGTPAVWALAVLLTLPLGRVGRWVEGALDLRARRYLGRARVSSERGDLRAAARQNLRAMWPQFATFGVLSAGAVVVGEAMREAFVRLSPGVLRGLTHAYPALVVVAAGLAVDGSHAKHPWRWGWVAAVVSYVGLGVTFWLGLWT